MAHQPGEERTQVQIEVARSRYHAQEAIGFMEPDSESRAYQSAESLRLDRLRQAAIHATLSEAAATRAVAFTYTEEVPE